MRTAYPLRHVRNEPRQHALNNEAAVLHIHNTQVSHFNIPETSGREYLGPISFHARSYTSPYLQHDEAPHGRQGLGVILAHSMSINTQAH